MAHPKKLEFTAVAGLLMQAAFVLTCWALASKSGSAAVGAATRYFAVGLLVWFLVLVHGRQRRLAREEREELEDLKRTRLSEEIFEDTELDGMRASAGLRIFEKYLVPFFSVVLAVVLLVFTYIIVDLAWKVGPVEVTIPAPVAMGMIFVAFAGFLIGKYAAGLAQSRDFRLLRAAGGYVLGNVIVAVMIAGAMALYYFEVTWAERAVTYVIPLIMALVGAEILVNLLLDIYRPRVAGQERRPPYDSRLLGLFAEPEGVLKTLAATLDYQFGFEVSETWFYRFMERAILPLVLVQVVSLWLLSCIVVVDQGEIVFIERLGRPHLSAVDAGRGLSATVFEPGLHLKAPWPFSVARHVPAYRVLSVTLGKVHEPVRGAQPSKIAKDDIILWDELHIDPAEGQEINFLVPSAAELVEYGAGEEQTPEEEEAKVPQVNLARVQAHVHYRVRRKPDGTMDEDAAFTFQYRQTDIQEHVKRLAYRAICRIAASQDFLKWLAQGRRDSIEEFERLLTEAIEREGLGIEVVFVGIPVVHPPNEAARAYADVVTSMEQREARGYEGEMAAFVTFFEAIAVAAQAKYAARGDAALMRADAIVDKDLFLAQLGAYRRAPRVYEERTYLDALERILEGQKLFLVPRAQADVHIIDTKERLRQTLIDLDTEG